MSALERYINVLFTLFYFTLAYNDNAATSTIQQRYSIVPIDRDAFFVPEEKINLRFHASQVVGFSRRQGE